MGTRQLISCFTGYNYDKIATYKHKMSKSTMKSSQDQLSSIVSDNINRVPFFYL